MTTLSRDKLYRIIVWTAALALLGGGSTALILCSRQHAPFFDIHALLVLLLVATFVAVMVSFHRVRSSEERAHVRELMQVQRELDKSVRRYRSLLEGAGTAIFVFSVDNGLLVEVNRRGTELLGYSKEEMPSLRIKDLLPEEDQEKFSSLVVRVVRRGRGRADGITFRRKGGDRFRGEIEARLIDLGDEKVVHATVRDITYKYRAERELRQRNRELSSLITLIERANREMDQDTVLEVTLRETVEVFGAAGGGIHLREREGHLVPAASWNVSPQLTAALGGDGPSGGLLERTAVTRSPLALEDLTASGADGIPAEIAAGWGGIAAVPLLAKDRVTGVMYLLSRDPRRFSEEEMRLFLSIADQMGIVIENVRLFNELKWKSDELMSSFRLLEKSSHELALSQHRLRNNLLLVERANLELERLDRMKSSFLGMISHEFRTPLTSIISGTEFLLTSRSAEFDSEARQVLDMINQGGERLSEIVNDILKVARLEAKTSPVTKTALCVGQVVRQVLAKLEPLIEERNLKIVTGNMEGLPPCSGDRDCFEEIFAELLGNSVKFTPDGGSVLIDARVVDRPALAAKRDTMARFNAGFYAEMGARCYLEVTVRDNGIGVSHDEQVKIFDKFYEIGEIRHHSSGKYKFLGKGAGLGLAIVKGMVEAHGGMVWVESVGTDAAARFGSAFIVLLPLEEGARPPVFPLADDRRLAAPTGMAADEE
ncbi:histidine kinase [Geotalea uraniireducens]|uniref:histidine kinase n=1 Tax=Geotalea uraniireducens TaxID=351604 RepID=A0ABM8ER07_9BACT|nr:PAS domain S-box protein [Geotalea uraniireducens]BDV44698.1 histidine kinase [Geotalea uraniireducens]